MTPVPANPGARGVGDPGKQKKYGNLTHLVGKGETGSRGRSWIRRGGPSPAGGDDSPLLRTLGGNTLLASANNQLNATYGSDVFEDAAQQQVDVFDDYDANCTLCTTYGGNGANSEQTNTVPTTLNNIQWKLG